METSSTQKTKRRWALAALLSAELLAVLLLFVAALLALAYLIRKVFVLQNTQFDESVFRFLETHISDRNNELMLFFTFLGTHNFLIPANLVLIAYYLFIRRHRWFAIKVPTIALSSLGLMYGLKHLFNRARPDVPLLFHADGLSFPSGHALFSITFYGLLIYLVYKSNFASWLKLPLLVLLGVLILVIGFSRVYLRVHYATDVLAGFCVGILWLVIGIALLNRLEAFTRQRATKIPA